MKKTVLRKILWSLLALVVLFVAVVIINFLVFQKMATVVSKGEPIDVYDEPQAALLVIDVQEVTTGAVSDNPYYMEKADELIQKVNLLSENFQISGKPVIYVRSEISNPLLNLLNNSYAKGSLGAQFDKRLRHYSGIELVKNRSDSFINTRLDSILSSHKVNELFITGLDAAHCINTTVEAAKNRNYQIYIVEEAVLAKSDALKDSMMIVFKERGVHVLQMNSLLLVD